MAQTVQNLAALLHRTTVDDHDEIIKACNAILKKSKHDLGTQYVKVVALLKCDRFEDAIRVIEDGGDALKDKASLEWSYALYKVGKLDEAIAAAAAAGSDGRGRGARHVEAQASYRAEKFQRTKDIYDELYKQGRSAAAQEEIDLQINLQATYAQLQWSRQGSNPGIPVPSTEDLEGFETTYNAACECIASNHLERAEQLLEQAKDLCQSSEDMSPEDKMAEILPICVQQVYVALQRGKLDHARSLAEEISVNDIPELSTRKVGQNNILAASDRNSNPYLQHKLFHSTPKSNDADKLFSFQSRIFNGNSYALDLLVQKFDGVERGTSKVLLHHGSCSTSPDINNLSVFNVAAHCRGETGKTSLKKALPLLQQRPNDIGLVLTLVQIYVGMNNVSSAISLVESLFERLEKSRANSDLDVRFNPGLVSVLVSLYESEGRKKAVMAELKKAATHWLERADQAPSLLRVAGISLLHSSNPSDLKKAGEIFSKLHELDTSDPIAAAGYVASYATMAPPTAIRSEAHRLSQVKDLVTDIDIAALEQAGVPALTSAGTLAALRTSRKRGAAGAAPEFRKKRIRKSRLPKDYDPNKQPDPERWLPMRDRSTYRPAKGKKGKQRAQDRTQGGIVTESGAEAGGPQPAQTTVSTSKKKKGKGKR